MAGNLFPTDFVEIVKRVGDTFRSLRTLILSELLSGKMAEEPSNCIATIQGSLFSECRFFRRRSYFRSLAAAQLLVDPIVYIVVYFSFKFESF